MINKDTNTQCRWPSIFFLLTLYNSLKNFLSGTSNAIFFTSTFLTPFSGENGLFGARPVGKMNTQMQVLSRCSVFFFHFGTFLQEKSEVNTFDWNHRLKSSGQELKSTEEFTGKIQGHSHYVWPVRFWFLDEFLQGTHLSVILTGTGVARWRWASKVF